MIRRIRNAVLHPGKVISYFAWRINRLLVRRVVVNGEIFHKYRGESYPDYLNHGNARSFITDFAQKWCTGKGLDIGADQWPFPGAIPIQDEPDQNAYDLGSFNDASMDYVFSSHCLEHLENWQDALRLWIQKLRIGGVLFLYLPHKSMKLWSPNGPWVGSMHKWKPSVDVLLPFLKENGVEIIEYNPDKDRYWSFHIIGKKGDIERE